MKNQINFDNLSASQLDLSKRTKNINGAHFNCCGRESWISCGSASLQLLTGISANEHDDYLSNFNDPNDGWFTSTIIKRLKQLGYSAFAITPKITGDFASQHGYRHPGPITDNHCLLLNVQLDSEDNSYFILHKGQIYHHCHVQPGYSSIYFINKPIQDVILVHHTDWSARQP